MKKSTLLALSLFLPLYAQSDHMFDISPTDCEVLLGGEIYLQGGTRIQSKKNRLFRVTKNNNDVGFDSSAAAHITIRNKNFDNWSYGFQLGLGTNNISNSNAGENYLDRTYLWIERDRYGRIEIGSNSSAASAMQTNGISVTVATGGADGSWSKYVNSDTFDSSGNAALRSENFITFPGLLFQETNFEDIGTHERSRKVTYYSPKFQGFQFGVSYIPDIINKPGSVSMPNTFTRGNRQEKNAIAGGVTWEKTLAPHKEINLALIGEYAKSNRSSFDKSNGRSFYNARAIEIGGTYRHNSIAVGASYGTHWNSNLQKISASISNGFFYSAGIKYDMDSKTRTSLSYFYSEKLQNPMNVVSIGIEHELFPGFLPYAETTYFNMNQKFDYNEVALDANGQSTLSPSSHRNEGTSFIVGTKMSF